MPRIRASLSPAGCRFRRVLGDASFSPRFRALLRGVFSMPRFRLALAAISRSRRMGKQSEAPKIGDGENMHLRHEVSHSHTPRTSDRACVKFLTESAMFSRRIRNHNDIWSKVLSQRIMRYRRPLQVWVREWNLWPLSTRAPLPANVFRIANFRHVKELRCFGTTLST